MSIKMTEDESIKDFSENMLWKKVKILRDKLKRVEQESQRMRAERLDLMKKFEQRHEEASRQMQKQIEFKELENQFKSQEIVELTMKYKVLESSVKRNISSISSTPYYPQQQQQQQQQEQKQQYPPPTPAQILAAKPLKQMATKRQAPSQLDTNANSDTENDNPYIVEVKRPLLSSAANLSNLNKLAANTNTTTSASTFAVSGRSPLTNTNLNNSNQITQNKQVWIPVY